MMSKLAGKVTALVLGAVLSACGGSSAPPAGTGSVRFALEIQGGQSVDKVEASLVCPDSNLELTHTLDVMKGEVVAVFGGLAPGSCTVSMTATTSGGGKCMGMQPFTVIANQVAQVVVKLACPGVNTSPNGSARVSATFEPKDCSADRIKAVYAIPGNVMLGESTVVNVLVNQAAVVGTPKFKFDRRNDAQNTGEGTLGDGECKVGSAACTRFTCTGLGAAPGTDPRTGLPSGSVFVTVEYEDDECRDNAEVWIDCVQGSVCGDGVKGGVEECDDQNTQNGDGCSSTCKQERCGDGVVQTGEECDGTAGVGAGQSCSAECKLVQGNGPQPACGDGIVNQASEVCDGAAGLLANQQCGPDCKIVPICGNNIVEGTEQCDEQSTTCVNCQRGTDPGPNACLACINNPPDADEATAKINKEQCEVNGACVTARNCILQKKECWSTPTPLGCYCGPTQADVDECETPTFQPKGPCAEELRAGSGANATNADVVARFFDFAYPSGLATVVVDIAHSSCNAQCF